MAEKTPHPIRVDAARTMLVTALQFEGAKTLIPDRRLRDALVHDLVSAAHVLLLPEEGLCG